MQNETRLQLLGKSRVDPGLERVPLRAATHVPLVGLTDRVSAASEEPKAMSESAARAC
jgi:hypothetical protein